ncbi:MAG TPA: glutathione peroxidase [Acholeplasmataceae bacterium]|nr:glutathione peroxidase [Acholeplasmataceae bacterium]
MKIYDIKVKTIDDTESTLKQYEKKVLLIVNTATGCGFTPQYEGLQKLYDKYQEKGLEILDFPCNQFGNQAPGTIKEINSFCSLNYGTTFPRFAKVDVNGENEAPIYKYLKSKKKGLLVSKIKWNFTKFLVDREGNIIKRYAPTYSPSKIEKDILKLL